MRLPKTNTTFSLKRRTVTTGNKKADATIQTGIVGLLQDMGTTADHQQTYLIMLNYEDLDQDINVDTDTLDDGTNEYKCMNVQKKTFHYQVRAIKAL